MNKKVPDKCPQSILLALDQFKLLYESNIGSGGLIDGKNKELLVNRGQAIVFLVLFVILVVPITPSIKRGMHIDYLCVLFCHNQIILL